MHYDPSQYIQESYPIKARIDIVYYIEKVYKYEYSSMSIVGAPTAS